MYNLHAVALPQVDDDLHDLLLFLSRELHGRPGRRKTWIYSVRVDTIYRIYNVQVGTIYRINSVRVGTIYRIYSVRVDTIYRIYSVRVGTI